MFKKDLGAERAFSYQFTYVLIQYGHLSSYLASAVYLLKENAETLCGGGGSRKSRNTNNWVAKEVFNCAGWMTHNVTDTGDGFSV